MTNKIIFIIIMLFMAFQGVYATDVYSGLDFNYEFGSFPQNLEVKVYKCQDSSCSEGKVSQIQTVLYSKDSKSACFKDLTEQQMNNCMNNYKISGDKAPAQGAVVKLTGVTPNTNEYYLVVVSAKDDTYITEHIRHSLNTEFEDYDYYSDFFSRTLTKVFRPKANIQSFYVDNLENPQLPIQVNVEAGMSTTVCSAFNYATNYFKPQFSPGYSDYAAKTDITLEVIDVDTGNVLAQNTKRMNIEASTCSGFHTFEWTPPQQYEDKEIEFKVRTNVVDNQAYLPREDRDSKVVTIYPEDLTNACWVNGNNLVVANKDTRNPQVGDFEITIGEDGFLLFEAEALQSIDKDGNNLRHINYRAQISIDGVEIINEVVTSNSGVYKKNIKEELRQFSEGEYEVRAILTPIGVGCSQSETSTLTTLVDLVEQDISTPDTPPVLNTPSVLNGGLNQQVSGIISASDLEDGDLTNQISCISSSSRITLTDNNGVLRITRTTDNSISSVVTCLVIDSDANTVSKNTQVSFGAIQQPDTPPVLNTPSILNGGLNQQVSGSISATDSEDGDLTNQISCSTNSNTITINSDDNGVLEILRLTDNSISATVSCSVTDSDGNSISENTIVKFTKIEPNTPPVLNTPNSLNGELNQQVQGLISAVDSEDGDLTNQISCNENSASISITDNNGVLQITRTTDNSIYATVTCSVQDSDGNSVSENTIVKFTKIEPNTPPVLNTPNSLNGGLNQQVQGLISASDSEDGDLTNQITCNENSASISISDNNGVLRVTRLNDNTISATVTCSVQDSDGNSVNKNTQVSFNEINPPTLNLPNLLNGTVNNNVSGFVSAQDSIDGDITNQISCTTTSNDITINTNGNSLIVERLTRFAINTTVECSVTNSNGLTAIGSTRVVFDLQNDAPQVTITPSTQQGYEVLNININVDAFDPNGDDITCTRIINGVTTQQDGSCSNFDLNLSQGIYNIEVIVKDEFGLIGSDSTQIEVLNKNPQEVNLRVNPQLVFIGDSVNISYSVIDDAGHVNCILETDNKLLQAIGSGNCVGTFNTTTQYSNTGLYNVTLISEDKNGNIVTKIEQVKVIENDGPQATLDVSPESGFAPVDGIVNVNATHLQNVSLTCEVTNNGIVISTSCNDTIDLNSLSKGTYTIEFNVIDGRGEEITLRDSIEVLGEEDKLGNQTIIVDTQSGNNSNVDVTIIFANETLAQRVTRFRPSIVCDDGVMNNYENEKWINTALVSRTDMNDVVFDFELFIDDFQLNIDYNEQCTLLVEFRDEYGFVVEKMADITFERPEEELKGIPSIRGQGIDFRNHLTTLLQDSTFEEGYNEFSVMLINNEDEYKDVRYTITGQDIFVKESGSYSLEAFEERRVPMNIYVPRGTQEGTYLVKITMDNNGVRESKYTYLRVGEESMLPTYTVEQNQEGFGEDSSISNNVCSTSEC